MSTPAAATIMNDEKSSLRIFSPEPIGDSDVVIHSSDGGVLNLHSVLLKMHSKVFAAALEYEDTADSKAIKPITLNYDFATLKIFFSGLGYELDYAQKVETAQAIKLIPLAHKYDVGSIVQTYMKHLLPLVPEMRLRPCSADGNTELSLLETLALAAKYGGEEVYRLSIKTLAEKHRAAADDKERRKRDDTAYFCATYPSLNQDDMKDLDAQSMEDLFVAFAELPRHDRCVDKLFDARVDLLRQIFSGKGDLQEENTYIYGTGYLAEKVRWRRVRVRQFDFKSKTYRAEVEYKWQGSYQTEWIPLTNDKFRFDK